MTSKRFFRDIRVVLALVAGTVGFLMGIYMGWQDRIGNTSDEIAAAERGINNVLKDVGKPLKGYEHLKLLAPSWDEIQEVAKGLTHENERIAKAKVFIRLGIEMDDGSIPADYDSSIWKERYKLSKQPWKVQERSERIMRSLLIGFGSALALFLAVSVLLVVLAWLWWFFLERVRELSRAIRGP